MILDHMFSVLIKPSKLLFEPNYFFGTLFFCSFQWEHSLFLYYDVYNQGKDNYKCDDDCTWYVHKDGPCRYEFQALNCYAWNI